MMEMLYEPLAAVLNDATFELEYRKDEVARRRLSAPELRAIYSRPQEQAFQRSVRLVEPFPPSEQFLKALRLVLEPFIDPGTDEVGHAFPINFNRRERTTFHATGYSDREFTSLLPNFARALCPGGGDPRH